MKYGKNNFSKILAKLMITSLVANINTKMSAMELTHEDYAKQHKLGKTYINSIMVEFSLKTKNDLALLLGTIRGLIDGYNLKFNGNYFNLTLEMDLPASLTKLSFINTTTNATSKVDKIRNKIINDLNDRNNHEILNKYPYLGLPLSIEDRKLLTTSGFEEKTDAWQRINILYKLETAIESILSKKFPNWKMSAVQYN